MQKRYNTHRTEFASSREIYEEMIRDRVPVAKKRLWIVVADIKDMYVDSSGRMPKA